MHRKSNYFAINLSREYICSKRAREMHSASFIFNNSSSHRRWSLRKVVFRNFAKFSGKHLCQSLFLIKLQLWAYNFIKKRLWHRCFSVDFAKFQRTPFLQNTCGCCFWKMLRVFQLDTLIKGSVEIYPRSKLKIWSMYTCTAHDYLLIHTI